MNFGEMSDWRDKRKMGARIIHWHMLGLHIGQLEFKCKVEDCLNGNLALWSSFCLGHLLTLKHND